MLGKLTETLIPGKAASYQLIVEVVNPFEDLTIPEGSIVFVHPGLDDDHNEQFYIVAADCGETK